jgi:hypothetical protein
MYWDFLLCHGISYSENDKAFTLLSNDLFNIHFMSYIRAVCFSRIIDAACREIDQLVIRVFFYCGL